MRFVNGNYIPSDEKSITFYGKTGDSLLDDEKHKLQHYAKVVQPEEGKATYYIRIYQSTPFDPMGPYGRRERNLDTQMKRVSKNTFDFYVTYLKTNNSIYLTKAQRGFLND